MGRRWRGTSPAQRAATAKTPARHPVTLPEAWEPFAAAAIAPVAVWVLWRCQTLSVEVLRWRLVKLANTPSLRWLYMTVSWLGVVLHELSHATVLLLSGHGIRQFRAGAESGHVLPARMQGGAWGLFSFTAAALAPLFIPPILVLAALHFLAGAALDVFHLPAGEALAQAVDAVRHSLVDVPLRVGLALGGLDLATWQGAACLAVAILAMPSSRPSHVKGSRFHGTKDEGDVPALRARIRRNPVPFILFLLLLYAAYFAMPYLPAAYWFPFQAVWAVALTGVALSLFGALWWGIVGLARNTKAWAWWLGPATFVACEVAFRAVPAFASLLEVNLASLAAWAAVAVALRFAFPGRVAS
jgi:hypothetical protein